MVEPPATEFYTYIIISAPLPDKMAAAVCGLVSYPAPTSANMADDAEGRVWGLYIILGGDCAISRDGHMLPYRVYMAAQCYRDAPSVHSLLAIRRQEDAIYLPFCAVVA